MLACRMSGHRNAGWRNASWRSLAAMEHLCERAPERGRMGMLIAGGRGGYNGRCAPENALGVHLQTTVGSGYVAGAA